ncbi:uncharacterized protein SPPG_05670 [Spizellomyces punctatus DAOM BR117]|uniref:Uncharacterized protein n=1 Tax=Spizellomyces punctatus (strain DAOM BR117) TaxID=645134 RepID=A0A0L0HEM2_SPIPD|nr:uncharacterized protein SPPG_05670 [Spizellomyces punctatus DAOM BR117]KNC99429.1 hypothetical protein SPPG_05670 [Spizellomyces punctatus DAOM BR117]|eukprot:XP_016607469.1 hypothetical protein SPPG_05670 [Spizellomyces punctatus DAOM BR117]
MDSNSSIRMSAPSQAATTHRYLVVRRASSVTSARRMRRKSTRRKFRRPTQTKQNKDQQEDDKPTPDKTPRKNVYHHPALTRTNSTSSIWSDISFDEEDIEEETFDEIGLVDSYANRTLDRSSFLVPDQDLHTRRSIMMLEGLLNDVQAFKDDARFAPTIKRPPITRLQGSLDNSSMTVETGSAWSKWEEEKLLQYLAPNNASVTPELEIPRLEIPPETTLKPDATDPQLDSAYSSLERRKRLTSELYNEGVVEVPVAAPILTPAPAPSLDVPSSSEIAPKPQITSKATRKPAGPRPMGNTKVKVLTHSPTLSSDDSSTNAKPQKKGLRRFFRKVKRAMHC